jgi:hypothetical protein
MYKPRTWPILAQQLYETIHGNGTAIYELQTAIVQLNNTIESDTRWAGARVGCSDELPWPVSKEDRVPTMLKQIINDVKEHTRHFAGMLEVCWNWDSETSERVSGWRWIWICGMWDVGGVSSGGFGGSWTVRRTITVQAFQSDVDHVSVGNEPAG